jgi:hypothetical protein
MAELAENPLQRHLEPRLCACGCGKVLADQRRNKRFYSDSCRVSTWMAKHPRKNPGGMHYSRLSTSDPLSLVHALLKARGAIGATTADIAAICEVTSPPTWVSMLRKNGIQVRCEYEGLSANGRRVYRYREIGE